MDLLRRPELQHWLLAKFGSASELAKELKMTRQTAFNLLNGKTIPSYDTLEKLGLTPVFLVESPEEKRKMNTLDQFLSKRQEKNTDADMKNRLLRERGVRMWDEFKQAVMTTAKRVGSIDGNPLEWSDYPFLKLEYVAATFTPGVLMDGVLKGCRVIFGRIPNAMYIDDNPIATKIWELSLSVSGNELAWNVTGDEIVGIPTVTLAEQTIMRLVEYRDAYRAAFHNSLSR
jgi:transcriptional regulator with XRE-family HTH domain